MAEKRGLHDLYLEQAELTKNTKKWDWSVGRISEPMGVTGYWFGKEYDGARVVYTDHKTQVSVGYGDFSQTTGITDSAYNHKELSIIHRAPTLNELLGIYSGAVTANGALYPMNFDPNAQANYREKFNAAGCIQDPETGKWLPDPKLTSEQVAEAKLAVCRELVGVLRDVDAELKRRGDTLYIDSEYNFDGQMQNFSKFYGNVSNADIQIQFSDKNNDIIKTINMATGWGEKHSFLEELPWNGMDDPKYGSVEGLLNSQNIKTMMGDILDASAQKYNGGTECTYLDHDGRQITRDQAINQMFCSFVGIEAYYYTKNSSGGDGKGYNGTSRFVYGWAENFYPYKPVQGAPIPLPGAPITFAQEGYLLKQDVIPDMDRAAYIKVRRQLSDTVGVEAWKLNSFGEGAQDSHGLHDMQIADVLGIGTQIRLGKRSMLSFDYGQNRSDMGKFFHGGRDAYGDYTGGGHTPDFWVARLDIGIADTDMPGSWHAYLDYKAFDHGSFGGGTGADLPDRYLDGIRSFTTGIGYVPARNLLLEASYTFGAKSTQMRDTLYTPENFSLGDYTRVQVTYKF